MNYLKGLREKSMLTQKEVANNFKYTAMFVSNWEKAISFPPKKIIKRLAKLYSVDASDIANYILLSKIELLKKEYSKY